MHARPTGTVTLLFTDIEGSTRLLHEHGERYAELLAAHRRALRAAFARHGGHEVDTQGDAFFVAFARASDALAAAADAQEALAGGPVRVRMGVHTGEPIATEEGYVGMDVHRGARICAAGHGGQVLVSETTAGLVGDRLRDLGLHRLKDLSAPIRLFQLGGGEHPPPRTLYRTNLPTAATPFVGRGRELAEVCERLARPDVRLLTLTGPGGIGKTRLALQAAAAAADAYPDGVWWVPLTSLGDPGRVLASAAEAIGAEGELAEAIGGARLLLFLDNLEHLVDAGPEVAGLLECCAGLDVLVTSREVLRVAPEHVYPVAALAPDEGRALFVARAAAARPDFVADDHVDRLCERLEQLPLALELAAARTRVLAPEQLVERLGARLDLLRGGRDADPRQRTLRATIEWSYDLLSSEERRLLSALAVFRGGWTLEAAEAVCRADVDGLQSLLEKSLVRRWEDGRFGMLETIRQFAEERLAELGGGDDLQRRRIEFLLGLSPPADLFGAEPGTVPPRVLAEQANVEAALEWALGADPGLGLRLAASLEGSWVVRDPVRATEWFLALLGRAPDAPRPVRALALRALGSSAHPAGREDVAERAYLEALELLRAEGDEAGAAVITLRLGYSVLYRGDLALARELGEASAATFRAAGEPKGEAIALGLLGEVEEAEGSREAGLELMRQSLALAQSIGFTWWRAGMLGKLSDRAHADGRVEEARALAAEALALSHELGDRLRLVRGLARLACLAAEAGEPRRAGLLWGAVEAEEARGRVGAWENERERFERRLLAHAGPELELGRADGRALALLEAVEEAVRPLD